jgi:hypothetical protein
VFCSIISTTTDFVNNCNSPTLGFVTSSLRVSNIMFDVQKYL